MVINSSSLGENFIFTLSIGYEYQNWEMDLHQIGIWNSRCQQMMVKHGLYYQPKHVMTVDLRNPSIKNQEDTLR